MTYEIVVTLIILSALLFSFVKQTMEIELAAFIAACALILFGIIGVNDVLRAFSNPAAATIATMFILSAALEKAGLMDLIGKQLGKFAETGASIAILVCFSSVFVASAFVNNTSVVLVMIPVIERLANQTNIEAKKLLIPLSYFAIMGGTCTLIGTSTSLLVDAASQGLGERPFGIFEASIPALIMASCGTLFLYFFSKKLLPFSKSDDQIGSSSSKHFALLTKIADSSLLIGKTCEDLYLLYPDRLNFVEIVQIKTDYDDSPKREWSFLAYFKEVFPNKNAQNSCAKIIAKGDFLFLNATEDLINEIIVDNESEFEAISQFYLGTNSRFIGREIGEINSGISGGVHVLGIARAGINSKQAFDSFHLDSGDLVILGGRNKFFEHEIEDHSLHYAQDNLPKRFKLKNLLISSLAVIGVIIFSALNIMPIVGAALIAVAIVILFRCISLQEAYSAIRPNALFLIFFMLAVSSAMEKSGALEALIKVLIPIISNLPPWAVISLLYLFTSAVTEVFSNSAAALMLTPIALGLSESLGLDSRAFLATIMLGASASFATPLGYQTNTLVFSAGNYKFLDFLRIGLPMNILLWLVASVVIPAYWGLF